MVLVAEQIFLPFAHFTEGIDCWPSISCQTGVKIKILKVVQHTDSLIHINVRRGWIHTEQSTNTKNSTFQKIKFFCLNGMAAATHTNTAGVSGVSLFQSGVLVTFPGTLPTHAP